MIPGDIARVLKMCNLYDPRFGEASVEEAAAWFEALKDLDGDDAVQAVVRHYATETDRILPAHVRRGVMAIRAERRRLEPSEPRALPSRFEDDMGRTIRMERGAATVRQILGRYAEHLAEKRPELPSAWEQLRELTSGVEVIDLGEGDVVEGDDR